MKKFTVEEIEDLLCQMLMGEISLLKIVDRLNEMGGKPEDIPKRKFKAGDIVRIKDGISSKTHSHVSCSFAEDMDKYIGQKLIVAEVLDNTQYGIIYRMTNDLYTYAENWLEPWSDELKNGDLAIFWDNGDKGYAIISLYDKKCHEYHYDIHGIIWKNAIKFESKEQFERLVKGEI